MTSADGAIPAESSEPLGEGPNAGDALSKSVVDEHTVKRRIPGRRLDKYLQHRHPRISRSVLQKYIKDGHVTVNGMPTKASYEPGAGDLVTIALPPAPPSEIVAEDIPLDIVYEDEWMLVINKQTDIVCHPANAYQTGTIANAVAFYAKTLSRHVDPFRPGIIHRLDKNTTGLMIIAKADEAHWRIALQFERRTIKKQYFAVCEGDIDLDGDRIDKPLAPHPATTRRMILKPADPPRQAMFKDAVTEYRVVERFGGYTSVDLFPKTGRTHQLRVHMASIGHPMVGDTLYGGKFVSEHDLIGQGSDKPLITHQALHARRLRLMHPIREEPLEIEAPLPANIVRLLELLAARKKQRG
ncbi:MAG: RluA family pseudouridine synthase [Phycisphaerae bacterium]